MTPAVEAMDGRAVAAWSRVPGSYWRELLAETLELNGSRSSIDDLMDAVSGCQAGLVDVAGWLCDEMRAGRVQVSYTEAGLTAVPKRFEMIPGSRSYRHRIGR